jgi:hypothetical protein
VEEKRLSSTLWRSINIFVQDDIRVEVRDIE